jgi:murein DD-endopeptidase MepM/ murein hydrolase activator NlpD
VPHPAPLRTPAARALTAAILVALVVAGAVALSSRPPAARAANVPQLQHRISAGQARISGLAGSVRADSRQIGALGVSIGALQRRLTRLQAGLARRLAELRRTRTRYDAARIRLTQLETYEAHAEAVLARQMVGAYESGQPDLVTVILEAHGFQDLLERLQFAQRVQRRDAQVVGQVRASRRAVAAEATRLGALAVREQKLATQILYERDGLARAQLALIRQRLGVLHSRSAKAALLASERSRVATLRGQVARIEAERAAAAARLAVTAPSGGGGGSPAAAPGPGQVVSAGGFTFPLPKGSAVGPGSWSLDQGVDISAPGNTPEYAVCSGTIVLHGIGGFGPWAPVLHCDGSLAGYSYVYYGHAGPANQLPVGTHVGAGAVMSSVGPGIVGISTGPHVEIGFSDASGTPIGGSSASTMMSLLRGAYG